MTALIYVHRWADVRATERMTTHTLHMTRHTADRDETGALGSEASARSDTLGLLGGRPPGGGYIRQITPAEAGSSLFSPPAYTWPMQSSEYSVGGPDGC